MAYLFDLLAASADRHQHLCPRQVLGVRMGMFAGVLLDLDLPQAADSKRLVTIVEIDGCAADGISVATNCWVGRRTLRIEDYGKVAATFVDTYTRLAVRIAPLPNVREHAIHCAPEACSRWEAQLLGYQRMPADELLSAQAVQLKVTIEQLTGRPGVKTQCAMCGEEIMNDREIKLGGQVLCRACAGENYCRPIFSPHLVNYEEM